MKICVLGAGYVGLTTAACLAHLGHSVTCVDVVAERIEMLRRGKLPIVEEGLAELVNVGLRDKTLRFALGAASAANHEFVFLCVPTPQDEDGSADMSYIRAAAADLAPVLAPRSVVVNKSTVPVGSVEVLEMSLARSDVFVLSNPEFLREGHAVRDFLHPERIVIGAKSEEAAKRLIELYDGIDSPVLVTDPATAETIKYASNAFLATKISFANALANLCEAVGANVSEVVLGMGYDKRIGAEFLCPGPGWGGSCLPKDTRALVHMAERAGYNFELLKGVISVNEEQSRRIVAKVLRMAGGEIAGKRIALWGLTFKAGTDDLRQSPALEIARHLTDLGAEVRAYDPTVTTCLPGIDVIADPYEACDGAHVLVVLTEWDEFRLLELGTVMGRMSTASIVDARNILSPTEVRRAGFRYEGVGRA